MWADELDQYWAVKMVGLKGGWMVESLVARMVGSKDDLKAQQKVVDSVESKVVLKADQLGGH